MGFFDQLKKTIWASFFGKPERSARPRVRPRLRKPLKKKAVSLKARRVKAVKKVAQRHSESKRRAVVATKKIPAAKKAASKPISKKNNAQKIKPQQNVIENVSKKTAVQKPAGVLIGTVTHFFPQVHVAAIKIDAQSISVGDTIHFKGVTTGFKTKIASMQINRVPVTQAAKGSEIGILVKKRVREGDQVFKL